MEILAEKVHQRVGRQVKALQTIQQTKIFYTRALNWRDLQQTSV